MPDPDDPWNTEDVSDPDEPAPDAPTPDAPPAAPTSLWGRIWGDLVYRFFLLFFVYLGVGAGVYVTVTRQFYFVVQGLMRLTVTLVHALLVPFQPDLKVAELRVYSAEGRGGILLIEECTGLYETVIFLAGVLSFPTTWRKRAIGVLAGVPTLYLINVVRVMALLVIRQWDVHWFEFFHVYFWQPALFLMISSVWALWLFGVVFRGTQSPDPAA